MTTLRCRKCTKKTLEDVDLVEDLQQGMILATSLCNAQGGDGSHDWCEIEGAGKSVSFSIDQVHVVHWDSGIRKVVRFNKTVTSLLESFTLGCREAFPEELSKAAFKIYALPNNYSFDAINSKQKIVTSKALEEVIMEQGHHDVIPRELHVFNFVNDGSPQQAPAPAAKAADTGSVASAETRDTDASLNCRAAANYTCAFCGYHMDSGANVFAAHLFELKHYNAIKTAPARAEALRAKGLGHIHDGQNLLCLCKDCHGQFDTPYNIGINPITDVLEVDDSIHEKYCGKGLFKNLVGKKAKFTPGWHAPQALLEYRYGFFQERGKISGKKRPSPASAQGEVLKIGGVPKDT